MSLTLETGIQAGIAVAAHSVTRSPVRERDLASRLLEDPRGRVRASHAMVPEPGTTPEAPRSLEPSTLPA